MERDPGLAGKRAIQYKKQLLRLRVNTLNKASSALWKRMLAWQQAKLLSASLKPERNQRGTPVKSSDF
jgi:hypothetical protein